MKVATTTKLVVLLLLITSPSVVLAKKQYNQINELIKQINKTLSEHPAQMVKLPIPTMPGQPDDCGSRIQSVEYQPASAALKITENSLCHRSIQTVKIKDLNVENFNAQFNDLNEYGDKFGMPVAVHCRGLAEGAPCVIGDSWLVNGTKIPLNSTSLFLTVENDREILAHLRNAVHQLLNLLNISKS
ncbi:MAG: hypothetical protein ACKN9T_08635 [Candidatus Methylumidiphilus sp.]